MNNIKINDISIFSKNIISIVFENNDLKKRDVAFFEERVSEAEMNNLKVWEPSPDDVVITVNIEEDLLHYLENWAKEREIEVEQILRGFIFYLVKYNVDLT